MRLSQKGIAPLIVSPQCSSCLNILTKNPSFAFLLVAVAMPDENGGDAMDDDEEIGREEWIRGERLSRSRAVTCATPTLTFNAIPGSAVSPPFSVVRSSDSVTVARRLPWPALEEAYGL